MIKYIPQAKLFLCKFMKKEDVANFISKSSVCTMEFFRAKIVAI